MRLTDALRLRPGMSVAFTGAGGKSTALGTLAREARGAIPFLATTTTRLGAHQSGLAGEHISEITAEDVSRLRLTPSTNILITGRLDPAAGKWTAPPARVLAALGELSREQGAILAIEADGARGRLVKAPAAHEPVVPSWVDTVVPVASTDAVGRALTVQVAHRPERIAAILGLEPGDLLTVDHLARLMVSSDGGLKEVPVGAEVRCLLTGAEGGPGDDVARRVLENRRVRAVAIGGPDGEVDRVAGRVAGLVLAAGGGARLGRSKPAVAWKGEPLIRHVLRAARAGGLDPIIVVLGSDSAAVRKAIAGEEVVIVENPAWADGQSTSVRAGIAEVESTAEAAVFLLADMPRVSPETIRRLIRRHQETFAFAVAPVAAGRRGNPVLFDRASFPLLARLTGDQGGRSLLEERAWEAVEADPDEFFDLDDPEDLAALEHLT